MKKRTIILVLGALAISALAAALYLYQKPVGNLKSSKATHKTSASQFFEAFETDEAGATALYNGKIIEVEGKVVEILQNQDESTTLILESNHPIYGVKCRLDPAVNQDIPLQNDQITLKGICTGFNADVELNLCIVL